MGSCKFNLTLINLSEAKEADLKEEKKYAMGKVAVSWHKDSSLRPFSTIGVYHHTPKSAQDASWKVAMCCSVAPALVAPLRDGQAYFMLGNFNHHAEHCVVQGGVRRYASTHRVANTEVDTYEYVKGE